MNKNTKIIWKAIDDLIPYEHNAKEHTEKQIKNLATSLQKYGWQNPILIDKDNVIVAGHGRVLGAKELGQTEVPCIYADDLTEEQVREYRILDNKLNESAWIDEELEFELPELDFSDFDLEFDVDEYFDEGYGTDFSLPDGDKAPFKQVTFTLANEQAEEIDNILSVAKKQNIQKFYDNFNNENQNGNALYAVLKEWDKQKT